ncbi:hypothetical protein HY030_01280 [Candidatus Gottesmanbacteria bacterium]|nr:hypothetical protein [Candidatus Gottesmanbacteria bacterium]
MTEGLHGHRLINGIHLAGIFLIGISVEWLFLLCARLIKNRLLSIITLISLITLILFPALKERYDYLKFNAYSIKINTALYNQEAADFTKIMGKIRELGPSRINIGRPGNWGRHFYVGAFSGYFVATVTAIKKLSLISTAFGWEANSCLFATILRSFIPPTTPTFLTFLIP